MSKKKSIQFLVSLRDLYHNVKIESLHLIIKKQESFRLSLFHLLESALTCENSLFIAMKMYLDIFLSEELKK